MRTVRWGRGWRWGAALGLGALWWWGVLRLALAPDAGPVEAAIAAGGWGLSLLPVHCVPKGARRPKEEASGPEKGESGPQEGASAPTGEPGPTGVGETAGAERR
ncbi:hypothetical protein [Streptomyces sp. NPDC046862]|uniref:hypothetical protein n=1 Tax=Streptomyces sp. NPDC046862 TaxID=3154603 RepID=UPI003455E49F